jgi:hypothetical protein
LSLEVPKPCLDVVADKFDGIVSFPPVEVAVGSGVLEMVTKCESYILIAFDDRWAKVLVAGYHQ